MQLPHASCSVGNKTNRTWKMWKNLPGMEFALHVSQAWTRGLCDFNQNPSKQFSTPLVNANSIQSCLGDGLLFRPAPIHPPILMQHSCVRMTKQPRWTHNRAFVTVSMYETRLKCPTLHGATWKSHVLLWISSPPWWQEPDSRGPFRPVCKSAVCIRMWGFRFQAANYSL